MQKVLMREDAELAREALGDEVLNYVCSEECETFESHTGLNIIAFDWYDTDAPDTPQAKMTLCVDKNNLIIFCEDERAYKAASACLIGAQTTERALCAFFSRLIRSDMAYLERIECRINATEVCRILGGGGHAAAAGCTVEAPWSESKRRILAAVAEIAPDFT